jgi:hypothetical protein
MLAAGEALGDQVVPHAPGAVVLPPESLARTLAGGDGLPDHRRVVFERRDGEMVADV